MGFWFSVIIVTFLIPVSFCQDQSNEAQSSPAQSNNAQSGQTQPGNAQPDPAQPNASRAITPPAATPPPPSEHKRILFIIPNYRTYPTLNPYVPISSGEKFKLAARDSFDPGTFLLAGVLGGLGQWNNSNPSYGQGAAGYGRYFGAAYGDLMIGNFMTVGVFPSLLHQDPRYFRRGTGSTVSRIGYAVSQIFRTHNDSGRIQFNYSEIFGNATAAGISTAYRPDNRNMGDVASTWATQIGLDAVGNVLKEFWPDIQSKRPGKHHKP